MESVSQWNVLANHVADRISKELLRQHYLHVSVYVRPGCGNCGPDETFPFDEGFNDLLTTQLVNFGITTVTAPEKADLTVTYEVQTVYHPSDYRKWNWLATAIDAVRVNYQSKEHYEVVITTSIVDGKRYVMRSSDIYYLDNANFWHYRKAVPAAEIRLTGSNSASRPATTKKTSL